MARTSYFTGFPLNENQTVYVEDLLRQFGERVLEVDQAVTDTASYRDQAQDAAAEANSSKNQVLTAAQEVIDAKDSAQNAATAAEQAQHMTELSLQEAEGALQEVGEALSTAEQALQIVQQTHDELEESVTTAVGAASSASISANAAAQSEQDIAALTTGFTGSYDLYRFTAVGGETTLSGQDDDSRILEYSPDSVVIFLNGQKLTSGEDYSAVDGSSITGLSPLVAGDIVEVQAFNLFSVIDAARRSNNLADLPDLKEARSNLGTFSSVAEVQSRHIPPVLDSIRTNGYASPGDPGGALYKRVAVEPGHAGKLQSADGQWWELSRDQVITPQMFGVEDGETSTAAIQSFLDFIPNCETWIPPGEYLFDATLKLHSNTHLKLAPGAVMTPSTNISPVVEMSGGGIVGTTSLEVAVAEGETVIPVGDASLFTKGDWVLIRDDYHSQTNVCRSGEIHKINSVDTDNDTITLEEPIWMYAGYDPSRTKSGVDLLSFNKNVTIEGGVWDGKNLGEYSRGLRLNWVEGLRWRDSTFVNWLRKAIAPRYCLYVSISGNHFENIGIDEADNITSTGYSIHLTGACQWVNVFDNTSVRSAKLFDVSGDGTDHGWTRFVNVFANHAYSAGRGAISTHPCGEFIDIYNNVLHGFRDQSTRGSIFLRTLNCRVFGNRILSGTDPDYGSGYGIRCDTQGLSGYLDIYDNYIDIRSGVGFSGITVTVRQVSIEDGDGMIAGVPDRISIYDNEVLSGQTGITVETRGAVAGVIKRIAITDNRVESPGQCIQVRLRDAIATAFPQSGIISGNMLHYGGGGAVDQQGAIHFRPQYPNSELGHWFVSGNQITLTNPASFGICVSGNGGRSNVVISNNRIIGDVTDAEVGGVAVAFDPVSSDFIVERGGDRFSGYEIYKSGAAHFWTAVTVPMDAEEQDIPLPVDVPDSPIYATLATTTTSLRGSGVGNRLAWLNGTVVGATSSGGSSFWRIRTSSSALTPGETIAIRLTAFKPASDAP